MRRKPDENAIRKIRKLEALASDLESGADFPITRLTTLKSLCADPKVAAKFALYIAKCAHAAQSETKRMVRRRRTRPSPHTILIEGAMIQLDSCVRRPTDRKRSAMWTTLEELQQINNEYKNIPYGVVRIIQDDLVLIIEDAFQCILSPRSAAVMAYRLARDYAERYNPRYGTGLIPESAPMVRDIVTFWRNHYGLDAPEW